MTVALVANIARPISSAISTAFSADSYGLLSSYGLIGGSTNPDAVIEALFANSEQGAWYDPSDLSTMFQDSTGTTPVTADGQPVGLILDKSKGLALGPELITNVADRDFSSDTGFWNKEGSATISGGVVNINNPAGTSPIYKFNFPNEQGGYYEIAFDITLTAGTMEVLCAPIAVEIPSGNGRKVLRIYRNAVTTFGIRTKAGSVTATGTLDNLTIKRVEGNHASQDTAAKRPLYKTSGGLHWLQFDGVDDALYTAAIDFTATDKLGIFTGARKESDASDANLIEFSTNALSGTGKFIIQAPGTPGAAQYTVFARGAVTGGYFQPSPFAAPITNVITALFDLAGATVAAAVIPRIDGVVVQTGQAGAAPGGGNFSSNIVYMFSRGQNQLYVNGRMYSMIILGRLAATQEITDTETWVAAKTGVTLP